MSEKLTICPTCQTTYKVTITQLSVAQGMVCCPKCSTTFNALSHLVAGIQIPATTTADTTQQNPAYTAPITQNSLFLSNSTHTPPTNVYTDSITNSSATFNKDTLLSIFDKKVQNSNIDLKTYLNNLNYFSTEPIGNLPALNWSEKDQNKNHGILHYFFWSILNLLLIGLLIFQFFWFNPKYLNNSPIMSAAYNHFCRIVKCQSSIEQYNLITIKKIKVKSISKAETEFSGELINYNEKSLALPIIKVELKKNGALITTYSLTSKEYLVNSLAGIQRIPHTSPFKFNFILPVQRKSFDSYSLEIIRP